MKPLAGLALALAALASPTAARAQLPARISDGVSVPSQNPASTDDGTATLINPAGLAFLPGAEARFSVIRSGDESTVPDRGYALDAALPLWIWGTGLRVDWLDPPDAAPSPFSLGGVGQRYDWIRWGNALRLGDFAAIGTTLAWSTSTTELTHKLFSVTSGLTLRPMRFVSLAVVARDWNTPTNDAGTTIEPSCDLALALRPIGGRKMLEVGGIASYHGDVRRWAGGATLGVDVPYVGALAAGAQLYDAPGGRLEVIANAGLAINLDALQVGGGAVFGNALTRAGTGIYATAALRAFEQRPKLPNAARVLRLRFDATPDVRGHVHNLERLWRIANDPEVEGVLLVIRAPPAPSLAHAEELVDALRLIKQRGKKVLCHLEDAGGRELYVCSEADRIAINPAGGLRFSGLASSTFYIGGLLDKLGVRADFVRIGAHKSAAEQLDTGPSDTTKADQQALLSEYDRLYLAQIARGRDLSAAEAKRDIADGPFIAGEARDHKLVDVLCYDDEIDRFVEEAFGRPVRIHDPVQRERAPEYWREPSRIALVYLHGDMIDGDSRDIPLVGIKLAGSYTIARALKQAREDSSVKAVVFRIETGGGSSLAADVILREAILTARQKPLIVSMGSKAASGGYYAAMAGGEIFADRATLTGSIGIFYGKVDVVGLLEKLGLSAQLYRTEPRADAESLFRPFSDEERAVLGKKVKQFYDLFVARVGQGRGMTAAAVDAVGRGRVWTGEQALPLRLVDHIGGLRQALARARELSGLPDDAPIVELPEIHKTLFQRALELAGVPQLAAQLNAKDASWLPPPLWLIAQALVPFMVLPAERPLARMEITVEEP